MSTCLSCLANSKAFKVSSRGWLQAGLSNIMAACRYQNHILSQIANTQVNIVVNFKPMPKVLGAQWFLEGVLKLVKDLDPNMPYFLSGNSTPAYSLWTLNTLRSSREEAQAWCEEVLHADNLWWSDVNGTTGRQPNLAAPRCLPCGYSSYGKPSLLVHLKENH